MGAKSIFFGSTFVVQVVVPSTLESVLIDNKIKRIRYLPHH